MVMMDGFVSYIALVLKLIMNSHKFSGSVNLLNIALCADGAEFCRDISPCSSKNKKKKKNKKKNTDRFTRTG